MNMCRTKVIRKKFVNCMIVVILVFQFLSFSFASWAKIPVKKRIEKADFIFLGEVIGAKINPETDKTAPTIVVSLSVKRIVKNKVKDFVLPIDTVKYESIYLRGRPNFTPGERVFLFCVYESSGILKPVGSPHDFYRLRHEGKTGKYFVYSSEDESYLNRMRPKSKGFIPITRLDGDEVKGNPGDSALAEDKLISRVNDILARKDK